MSEAENLIPPQRENNTHSKNKTKTKKGKESKTKKKQTNKQTWQLSALVVGRRIFFYIGFLRRRAATVFTPMIRANKGNRRFLIIISHNQITLWVIGVTQFLVQYSIFVWERFISKFAYLPFFSLMAPPLLFFFSFFSLTRRSGPWTKEYAASISWSLTWRLPRLPAGHFFAHWESGSVALHTITWQWTNTNESVPMNLAVSRLNRWKLIEGAGW